MIYNKNQQAAYGVMDTDERLLTICGAHGRLLAYFSRVTTCWQPQETNLDPLVRLHTLTGYLKSRHAEWAQTLENVRLLRNQLTHLTPLPHHWPTYLVAVWEMLVIWEQLPSLTELRIEAAEIKTAIVDLVPELRNRPVPLPLDGEIRWEEGSLSELKARYGRFLRKQKVSILHKDGGERVVEIIGFQGTNIRARCVACQRCRDGGVHSYKLQTRARLGWSLVAQEPHS